jgi:hypothetical protein
MTDTQMKDLNDSRLFDEIIRDAVKHRTLHNVYFEAGYREGVRDTERKLSLATVPISRPPNIS